MKRVRAIFWAHATIALYCVACGLWDLSGHFRHWMLPSVVLLYGLLFLGSTVEPHDYRTFSPMTARM